MEFLFFFVSSSREEKEKKVFQKKLILFTLSLSLSLEIHPPPLETKYQAPVHQLGLDLWRDVVVRRASIGARARAVALAAVDAERGGAVVDRALLRSFTSMLADLGQAVYASDFESFYLEETSAYYAREAAAAMRELRPPRYLSAAEDRLAAEADRVAHYLDASTSAPATAAVERELLGRHAAAIVSAEDGGAVSLMKADALSDLARMYGLMGRVEGGHDLLRAAMSEHVRTSGAALVRSAASSSASAAAASAAFASTTAVSASFPAAAEPPREPIAFVDRLLSEKAKYDTIVRRSFGNDKSFGNALNAAFEHFVNLAPRAPEFVSLYMDDRLRRAARGGTGGGAHGGGAAGATAAAAGETGGERSDVKAEGDAADEAAAAAAATTATAAAASNANDDDNEAALDRALVLFRFLQEKDVFERYYKSHLAKRLLSGRPLCDDAERRVLVRLKTECGYQFTSKLESMFADVRTSRDLNAEWKAHRAQSAVAAAAAASAAAGPSAAAVAGDGAAAVAAPAAPAAAPAPAAASTSEPAIELSVQVLTTGSWPTPAPCACSVPRAVAAARDAFVEFYLSKHGGRRLAWQPGMGSAELRAVFGLTSSKASSAPRRHELTVSPIQACVLLAFNDAAGETLTLSEIAAATGATAQASATAAAAGGGGGAGPSSSPSAPPPSDPAAASSSSLASSTTASGDLKRALQSLACVKGKNVLRKSPAGKDVDDGASFSVNDAFSSRLFKVKIGTVSASRSEAEPERAETRARVDEDRKPQVEAAIVRVMKARRVADHNAVVAEVTRQLAGRFVPPPPLVKKRIESLIEREFLERDAVDRKLYRYLA